MFDIVLSVDLPEDFTVVVALGIESVDVHLSVATVDAPHIDPLVRLNLHLNRYNEVGQAAPRVPGSLVNAAHLKVEDTALVA